MNFFFRPQRSLPDAHIRTHNRVCSVSAVPPPQRRLSIPAAPSLQRRPRSAAPAAPPQRRSADLAPVVLEHEGTGLGAKARVAQNLGEICSGECGSRVTKSDQNLP